MSTDGAVDAVEVGYASGVFDMFHIGHLNLLRRSREHCQTLVVGVASDEYVMALKGRAPVVPLPERLEIVSSLRFVDEVIVDRSEDKRVAWGERNFDAIFKGDDWRGSPKGARLEDAMADVGARVVYFPYTLHTSSTRLRTFIERAETDFYASR
ncbi:cytidyltransferase [Aeromicrobium flavum]|uniref:Cytidyltransferase n=1 Tax=Aeromicrobium flavum TaxID=416568 RepID=A0A512HT81_9ACTN|nr:adenylyltransferase/cytidyltransferase family protein [Aeromicrobium flavum]GEO88663.1 cytidyltransferase [Aeromicrobium flavum]